MAEEKKSAGAELFDILAKYEHTTINATLTPDDRGRIQDILGDDPKKALTSPEFAQAVVANKDNSELINNVFNNLQELGGENNLIQGIENPKKMAAEAVHAYYDEHKTPDLQQTQTETNVKQVAQNDNDARKTLTIDQLKDGAYRGTLTAEQEQQLKNAEKNIANLENKNGDLNRSPQREKSKDRFKDEDVIKYMYEEWFLGGASWLFNKVEDYTLGIIDAAVDEWNNRDLLNSPASSKKGVEKASSPAQAKMAEFQNMVKNAILSSRQQTENKKNDFEASFGELRANLDNPNASWTRFDPNSDFVKNLQNDPNAYRFINNGSAAVDAYLTNFEAVTELSMQITATEMLDGVMHNDSSWHKSDAAHKGEYKDISELQSDFLSKSTERRDKIMKTLQVTEEDARLKADILYDQMPDPKPDKKELTEKIVRDEINSFIQDLANKSLSAAKDQTKSIHDEQFDAVGKAPANKDVANAIAEIDTIIDNRIKDGKIYSGQEFESSKSKERMKLSEGMFDAAQRETSSGVHAVLEGMQQRMTLTQDVINHDRANNQARKERLEAVKAKFEERDGKGTIDNFIANYKKSKSNTGK